MSTKLFVGNLSFNTTENDLQEAFAAHGSVVEANLMMDRMTGRSRGFAFITYSTPEEAQKAIEAMNGAQLDGRALTVNIARPKEERPPGGGGRDRGGRRATRGGGRVPPVGVVRVNAIIFRIDGPGGRPFGASPPAFFRRQKSFSL